MGIIKQGILGGFSGTVGPVIGSSWKGIDYMKGKPTSVANPRTAPQVAQRTKFSNAVAFAQIILASVIKPLRDRFAVQMSGFNTFVQDNIALFTLAMPAPANELVIASGKMEKTSIDAISGTTAGASVDVDWISDSGTGYKLSTDKAYIVCVNESTEEIVADAANVSRADENVNITFSANLSAGDVINAYLVFLREDGTVVSNTSFKTITIT